MADLDKYMRRGGGLVVVHAADSGFGSWPEFNRMSGVGGWGGRDEKTGPMIRFRDGKFVRDMTPKPAGHHGAQHAFQVAARQPDHPILKGLPPVWMHAQDEFYDSLGGTAENLDVLATGLSAKETGGTGENEPILMTVRYEKGRTFHTILGHHVEAMRCVGFIVTLQRGTEWAATGVVTQKVPDDFPGENEAKVREFQALFRLRGRRFVPHLLNRRREAGDGPASGGCPRGRRYRPESATGRSSARPVAVQAAMRAGGRPTARRSSRMAGRSVFGRRSGRMTGERMKIDAPVFGIPGRAAPGPRNVLYNPNV
jgi:hypothetical protein